MKFFTSDTHFSHYNIIRYCNRPFNSSNEMNDVIVENWNSVISQEDEVYHLGDVCFGDFDNIRSRLNGKIYLIKGNHDRKVNPRNFEWIKDYYNLKVGNTNIILSHYAFAVWDKSHHGSIHLYGHSHGTYTQKGKCMDVGVDTNNFHPYSLDTVLSEMDKRYIHNVGSH